jgi:hypothetical protein
MTKQLGAWAAILSISLLTACSGGQKTRWVFHSLIGQHVNVQVPAALDFPDTVVLDLGVDDTAAGRIGSVFAGAMLGESVESKVGKAVKAAALPLRSTAADALRRQVVDAKLFGQVATDAGDVRLGWGVGRWGLVYDKAETRLEPVLDLEATLSVPGVGVLWRGKRSAADLGAAAKKKAAGLSLAVLAGGSKSYQDVLDVMVQDLGGQLLDDLAKARPKRRVRAVP